MQQSRRRYTTLDAIRGVAALFVLWVHWAGHEGWPQPPAAFIAVDLFFMLSGFVIAASYGEAIAAGMTFRRFMAIRLIRMAPLNIMATVLMLVVWMIGSSGQHSWTPVQALLILAPMAIFVPAPPCVGMGGFCWLFPANPPLWSIFYELIANAAFVLLARRIGLWGMVAVGAVAGLIHLGHGLAYGYLNYGAEWGDLIDGMARAFYGFFVGVALFRLRGRLPRLPAPALVLVVLVAVLLYGRLSSHYYVLCLYLLFPLLIHAAAETELPARGALTRVLLIGGAISYGVYVLHVPVRSLMVALAGSDRLGPGLNVVALSALLIGAWALDRWYDAPLRRWWRARRSI